MNDFQPTPVRDPHNICQVNAQQMDQRMEQLFTKLRAEMKKAQAVHFEQGNKSPRVKMELQIRDNVWIDARNQSTARLCKKLDWKCIGPYDITVVLSPWAYRVKLSSQLCIHDDQPIFRLENATLDPLSNQKQGLPPPPVIVDAEEKY
jgi:hypothetical protein